MTIVAGVATGDMGRMLADSSDAVVAGTASANYLSVIDGDNGRPYCRAMTIFTDIRCLHVRRVLAGRLSAVMTADAVAKDVNVIEIGRHPADRRVTVIAGVAAGDVSSVLAGRTNAVMAANTITNNTTVIENSGKPASRVVAVVALIAGRNMIRCFPRSLDAVVAGHATACDRSVIHEDAGGPR